MDPEEGPDYCELKQAATAASPDMGSLPRACYSASDSFLFWLGKSSYSGELYSNIPW